MLNKKANNPLMFVKITPEETETAKKVKNDCKVSLEILEGAFDTLKAFKNALSEEHPSKDDLINKYKGRLLKYKRKIQVSFNQFLVPIKITLNLLDKISDPNIERIRGVIVAEISEMSEGINNVLELLKDPAQKDFTAKIEELYIQIEKRVNNIKEAINNQLFGYIEKNILGKLKISSLAFNIRKRKRILTQL